MALRYSPPKRFPGRGERYYSRVYDPATGKRSWASCETNNLKAAKEWVATRQVEAAMGLDRAKTRRSQSMLFSEVFESLLAEKELKTSARRHHDLETVGAAYWDQFFGGKPIQSITSEDVEAYLKQRRAGALISPTAKEWRLKKPQIPSARTLNNELTNLRTLFRFARRKGWLRDDPTVGVERYSGEPKRRIRSLTPEQEDALLEACRSGGTRIIKAKRNVGGMKGGAVTAEPVEWRQRVPAAEHLFPFVLVAMRCGFRRRTLCELEWQHLDLDAAEWHIPAELMKIPEDYVAPVPQVVVQNLKAYRAALLDGYGTERVRAEARIFGLDDGTTIRRSFKAAAMRAGVPKLTLHDLRRHYLNGLRRAGVGLETAMALTAHRSVATVMKHYREVSQEELRDAVKAVEGSQLHKKPEAM